MREYRNFIREDLESGYIICRDVQLPSGSVCTVFFSPSSVYVLSEGISGPSDRYRELQNLLGAIRLRLYILSSHFSSPGLYDPLGDTVLPEMDADTLKDDINFWLSEGRVCYDSHDFERMISRLKTADIQARGYVVQDDGETFLLRHGELKKASPVSSELQFYLTAFLGPLGIHRFLLGKVFTGILYLFTGGFFLVGWLVDLLFLLIGAQKDKKKRYLFPLENRRRKLLILPFGLLSGLLLYKLHLSVSNAFSSGMFGILANQYRNMSPGQVNSLVNFFTNLFNQ